MTSNPSDGSWARPAVNRAIRSALTANPTNTTSPNPATARQARGRTTAASPGDPLTDQNEIDYTIDLEHEGETTQELGGTLQRDHDEMPITYTYCVPNASGDNC